jgi:hypothetical protein
MDYDSGSDHRPIVNDINYEPMLERLTQLENNFSLLLSRGGIEAYASLDEALAAPSRFAEPINVKVTDPIAAPKPGKDEHKMPFWRSRIIALYIDWVKTFSALRKLPYSDKIALITNHASSYMIMCEAFRTPEHINESALQMDFRTTPTIIKQEVAEECPEVSQPPAETPLNGDVRMALPLKAEYSPVKTERDSPAATETNTERPTKDYNVHTFFDPALIQYGNSCVQTGVRSICDVPPVVHYPTVGSLSGLTPVMTAMIDYVMKPFRKLNITTTEFATLQAIMFFDPDTEGLDAASQRNVDAEQKKYLTALYKHVSSNYSEPMASERYASILLRIPIIRKVAAKKNQSLEIIDMFNLFTLNSLVKETALGIRQTIPTEDKVKTEKFVV